MQHKLEISETEAALFRKLAVPPPRVSPEERWRSLMATRNEWKLYPRTCDATGAKILSAYSSDSPFTVYRNDIWWGDGWNALDYGREYDFNRPFFEQFAELQQVVPREGTSIFNSENCEYNSHIRESKNCYLNSLVVRCEDTLYSYWMVNDKDTVDSLYAFDCTRCYWCAHVRKCYNCVAVEESMDSSDCCFSYELRNCDHCIFSSNLVHKSYYAFNKPCSKEEFEQLRSEYLNGSPGAWETAYAKFLEVRKQAIHRAMHGVRYEHVSGDQLFNAKNCINCFDADESEDCANCISLNGSKNVSSCYSAGWPGCEQQYYCAVLRGCTGCAFCTYTWFSQNMRYSDSCISSRDSFGCIGLHHKEYCILNKQYSKEAYEQLIPRIIAHMEKTGEWGQFFPPQLSPFAFNETAALEYFPLSKKEALLRGYRWRDETAPGAAAADIDDPVLSQTYACTLCGKHYKIITAELKFYKSSELPIPDNCPQCRHHTRLALNNPFRLWDRPCTQCGRTMQTTYAPDRPETVYCEKCYLETIY